MIISIVILQMSRQTGMLVKRGEMIAVGALVWIYPVTKNFKNKLPFAAM
jgi:hypothetical protein